MKYYPEGINDSLLCDFKNLGEVKEAMKNGDVKEGYVVLCDKDHNLYVDLGFSKGIIPKNEGAVGILEGTTRDIALISKVGRRVAFKIIGFHKNENKKTDIILSRRSVQLSCLKEYIDNLSPGDIIPAKVTHLENFGAFIDIGAGINSLIPIDMLSVSRISHPRERLFENQIINCVLKSREDEKLTFSLKELLGTWEENVSSLCVGETVTGIVRSVESYGIFIELAPNLAGLAEYSDGLKEGKKVSVYIKSIIPEKMKVKLVIVESFNEKAAVPKLKYFEKAGHISRFEYSPKGCEKLIETVF